MNSLENYFWARLHIQNKAMSAFWKLFVLMYAMLSTKMMKYSKELCLENISLKVLKYPMTLQLNDKVNKILWKCLELKKCVDSFAYCNICLSNFSLGCGLRKQ